MSGTLLLLLRLAMAAALYAFLAWALITLWRELRQQEGLTAVEGVPPIQMVLQTIEGPIPYQFAVSEVLIGRDRGSDCYLEDLTVSGRHARLSYHNSQWWVEDLGSTNGTYLNDDRVDMPVVLTSGDELRIGQMRFMVHIDGEKNMPGEVEKPGFPAPRL